MRKNTHVLASRGSQHSTVKKKRYFHLAKRPNFLLSFKPSPRCTLPPILSSRFRHQVSAKLYNTGTPQGNAESQRALTAARVLCQIEFQDLRDRERWMLVGMCTAFSPFPSPPPGNFPNFGSVELTKCCARRSRN